MQKGCSFCFLVFAVLVVICIAFGPYMYFSKCNEIVWRQCSVNRTTCDIQNHSITETSCNYYDDDDNQPCYQLNLNCEYATSYAVNEICTAPYGYFASFQSAENYYENHFTINESIAMYFLNNGSCSFNNPIYQSNAAIGGFVLMNIGFFFLIVLIVLCLCKPTKKYVVATPTEYTPINRDNPPKYEVLYTS